MKRLVDPRLTVRCLRGHDKPNGVHLCDGRVDFENNGSRFGVFDDRSGGAFGAGCLFVSGARHDQRDEEPESQEDTEYHQHLDTRLPGVWAPRVKVLMVSASAYFLLEKI